MLATRTVRAGGGAAVALLLATAAAGQAPHEHEHAHPAPADTAHAAAEGHGGHGMWSRPLGGGWTLGAMAQVYPLVTSGAPLAGERPVHDTEAYATQPAVMLSAASPGSSLVLHGTLNLEAWTQRGGEYTFGGWGEGFIDKRHPHTLLHELVLSANLWDGPGGALSLSAGKGFAPYGTEDPMGRPTAKFPTNHHLSQLPERWLVAAGYLHRSGLSVEAGVFGGGEPEGPYDFGNLRSFGDSWSARLTQRLGGSGGAAPWELSASAARVEEAHHGAKEATRLYNAAVRHERAYPVGRLYALAEASRSEPDGGEGHWSLLGEARLARGRHRPYYRVELATRPEYERAGAPGTPGFYRYEHGAHEVGASRWLIHTLGYEAEARGGGLITRPFVEAQHNRVSRERGEFDPAAAFGAGRFWSVSAGFKLFLGGDAMRMGSYGVLDPMAHPRR